MYTNFSSISEQLTTAPIVQQIHIISRFSYIDHLDLQLVLQLRVIRH